MRRAICPTCGNPTLKVVCRDLERVYDEQRYVVPDLVFEECDTCGERLFGPEAMRKIESYSPAFTGRLRRKPSAKVS